MKYAPFEKLNINLDNSLNKNCIYKERIAEQSYSKKCRNQNISEYMKEHKETHDIIEEKIKIIKIIKKAQTIKKIKKIKIII
jgi:hypothetical protein